MKGDLLSQATRALRENVDGASDSARATEERVVSLLPRKRRLRLVRPWGFSMAALLIGSSVWAMGGAPIKSWLGRLADSSEQLEAAPPAAAPAKKRVRNRSSAPQPALATTPPPSTDDEPLVESPEAPPSAEPPPEPATAPRKAPPTGPPRVAAENAAAAPTSEPPTASPPVEPAGNAALDLYERAHDLHFKRRDYTSALAAWDQYLTLAPSGSLALEARFHRGVCLVRLGRNDEARRALEPFARGDYGTYRRAQAQKLLDEAR